MSKTEWVNMGDINFLAYGGCLVKPHFSEEELKDHESLENTFDVFYLNTEFGENGDENLQRNWWNMQVFRTFHRKS